jgi:hypothetical protein
MANADLETRYRAYLDVLNERRLDDLVHYVHDELSYNGETMTRRQYQDLIAADVTAIPTSSSTHTSLSPAAIRWRAVSSSTAYRSGNFSASHRTANDSSSRSTSSISSATGGSQRYCP